MKKIVLTIASLLFASSMAFAGSDHFGSTIPAVGDYPSTHSMVSGANGVDMSSTKSIAADGAAVGNSTYEIPESGQGIWGH